MAKATTTRLTKRFTRGHTSVSINTTFFNHSQENPRDYSVLALTLEEFAELGEPDVLEVQISAVLRA